MPVRKGDWVAKGRRSRVAPKILQEPIKSIQDGDKQRLNSLIQKTKQIETPRGNKNPSLSRPVSAPQAVQTTQNMYSQVIWDREYLRQRCV